MKKPKIRFKGFTETWEQRKLGNIVKITMGQSPDGSTYSNVPSDYILVQGNADLQNGWVHPRIWTNKVTKKADAGDLIMSVRAPAGTMGKTAYDVVIGRGVASIKGNEFIFQALVNLDSSGYWKKYSCGSTFESLNSENINNALITIPKDVEQKKIGSFFTKLDNLITLHQRKCDELKKLKKFMLQKLFPQNGKNIPEIRFSGFTDTWEQRKFGNLVVIERGGSPRPIKKYITDDKNGLNWIKIGDAPESGNYITKTKEKIKPEGLSKTREVHPNDLILSNSMSFGRPYIMGIDGCIHDGWLLIRDTTKVFDLKYLCCMLGSDMMLSQYKALAAGSTVNNLNKELVGNAYVNFPKINEQILIGNLLDNCDHLITLHQRKCDELKSIKKYMLQNMFV